MTACVHSVDFIQHNEDLENLGTFDLAGVDNWRGMLKEFGIKLALLRGTDGAEIARYSP